MSLANAPLVKVVVLGTGGVGKSALTVSFVQQIYVDKYDPTIEDSYRKYVEVEGQHVMLEILDTAGTDQFAGMRDVYMRTGDGFLICYSTVAMKTFNDIPDLIDQIVRIKDVETTTQIPMILIGTKVDLADQRVVTTDMGRALASKYGADFLEVSAKARVNVDASFSKLCELIMKKKAKAAKELKKGNRKSTRCTLL